ncbi:MAG: exo-alpha-sialidase, partial [Fibrella sp.]|nr:exo-alpha-sialidase [Armatimonadota bacterium]
MKFLAIFPHLIGVSLLLTGSILPSAGQAGVRPRTHTKPSPPAAKSKTLQHPSPTAKSATALSPLDTLKATHDARFAAHAHKATPKKAGKERPKQKREFKRTMTGGDEFMLRMRAYPYNTIDPTASDRAIAQRSRLRPAQIGYAGGASSGSSNSIRSSPSSLLFPSAKWSFVGPVNWYPTAQRAYYGLQSMNGHVEGITVDPTNRLVLYACAQSGGVFKSVDGGISWKSVSGSWPYLRTNVLAINPLNTKVLYAGTSVSPTGFGTAIGLMKSTDGGTTWTNIGADKDANGDYIYFAGQNVSRVLVDAVNPNIVTVTVGTTQVGSSIVRPTAGNIWVSTDAGATWSQKVEPFPFPGEPGFTYSFRGSYEDIVRLKNGTYLVVGKGPGEFNQLLYKSTDQGATWTQVANAP